MSSAEAPVALLTGTNRGTGLAIASALHKRGYRLFSLNRNPVGEPWLGELRCDLACGDAVNASVARVVAEAGRLDAVVSNAVDRGGLDPIAELSPEEWDRQIAINLNAVFRLLTATLPELRRSRGMFLVMGSNAGHQYFEGGAAYSASKAALRALVETLLLEERGNGVRACLVTAGAIANLDGDDSPYKMRPEPVGECVATIIDSWAADLVIGEIDIRPTRPDVPAVTGIDRLLHV